MNLEPNVGTLDRSIRCGLATLLAALAIFKTRKAGWRIVLLGLAGLLGFTAVSRHCPAYAFADIDTLPYRTPTLKMGSCGGGCEGCSCA
jgi:hypothetical protein